MSFLIGVSLMAASMLVFSFAYSQTHRAPPARWTNNFYAMSIICVAFASAFPFGLIVAVDALVVDPLAMGLALAWELPVAGAILLAAFWVSRRIMASAEPAPAPAPIVPLTPRPRPVPPTKLAA